MSSLFPLERFLLGDPLELPEASLHELHLAPYAYSLYTQHQMLEQAQKFRAAHVQAQARHALVKHQLVPLMKAWLEMGLRPVMRKGFALAEFEYARAADRFYGDVDVWFPEDQAALATQMAQDLGWSLEWQMDRFSEQYIHQFSSLISPNQLITLEIHRRLVIGRPLAAIQTFDQQIAKGLRLQDWEGMTIWLLAPMDALISAWIDRARGDEWGRKLMDILDARVLINTHQFSRQMVLQRAKELGCLRTIEVVLKDFDPWREICNLQQPSRWQRWLKDLQTWPDFGSSRWDYLYFSGPAHIRETWGQMVNVLQVCYALRHQPNMHQLIQSLENRPRAQGDTSTAKAQSIFRGCRRMLMLLGWQKDSCVPRALSVYRALQLEGHKPHFVSGIRRQGTALLGHAWVELEGKPIYGSGDEQAPSQFKENFRYPSKT